MSETSCHPASDIFLERSREGQGRSRQFNVASLWDCSIESNCHKTTQIRINKALMLCFIVAQVPLFN
jgi:hypothetical protein